MDIEIRPIDAAEWQRFCRTMAVAYGPGDDDGEDADLAPHVEYDRTLAAFDGDQIVATAGAFSLQLTLPGLVTVPAAGLGFVAVLPTHRRRGILGALMRRHFDDAQARGEPVSLLYASEAGIYGRIGYGTASDYVEYELDPRRAAFQAAGQGSGRVRLVEGAEALRLLPEVHDRHRRRQPGDVARFPWLWELLVRDPKWLREFDGPTFFAVHEAEPGSLDGYVIWRVQPRWSGGLPDNLVRVRELIALTPQAEGALWRLVLDLDLAGTVQLGNRPLDEPLRWRLADSRQLRTTRVTDGLWVRLLDLQAALAARGYAADGALVLEVADPLRPGGQGRFRLEAGQAGATCARTDADPDLVLDVAALGAVWLGGMRLASLARAGRVRQARPGVLARADAMFACDPAPWSTTIEVSIAKP
jgi:predicted acetyltransferase